MVIYVILSLLLEGVLVVSSLRSHTKWGFEVNKMMFLVVVVVGALFVL